MRRLRAVLAVGATAVCASAIAAVGLTTVGSATSPDDERSPSTTVTVDPATATVRRGDLASERDFTGEVSFGDPWTIRTAATGTVTRAHPMGTVVEPGTPLIWIDEQPVRLVQGDMPMYRTLQRVDTGARDEFGNRLELQTGADVRQLQAFLLAEGFDDDGRMAVDGEFGRVTERAVEAWQEAEGLPVSGQVDSDQVVFSPSPVRLNTEVRVGDEFGAIEVTRPDGVVLVDTSTRDRSAVSVGTTVEIDVGSEGGLLDGRVTEQRSLVGDDGSRTWRTTIVVDGSLTDDAVPAAVTTSQVVAEDALLVPASALLALSEGGFALEVTSAGATRLVAVDVGEVLDGVAEISGDVEEGDTVVMAT